MYYVNRVFGGITLVPGAQPLNFKPALNVQIIRDPLPGNIQRTPRNLNYGFPDNSVMSSTVKQNSLTGTLMAETIQVLGHFSLEFLGEIIVPRGHSFGVGVFEDIDSGLGTNENIIVSLTITWFELDIPA